jgi:leucyl aminopeptidase
MSASADVVVVGIASAAGTDVLVGVPQDLENQAAKAFGRPLLEIAAKLGAASKPGTVVSLALPGGQVLLVTGLGGIDVTAEQVRRAAGAAAMAAGKLSSKQPLRLAISFDAAGPELVRGIVEGALLGSYRYRAGEQPGIGRIDVVAKSGKPNEQALQDAALVATAVCQARDWINLPANDIYPQTLADRFQEAAKGKAVEVTVWDEKYLAKEGFGGIMAVGSGSARPPRLVRASYQPKGAKKHLILVGKGITFDSGGLDLKTQDGMYTMKTDMSGAASVFAALLAIAELGAKVKVTAFAPLAENMPSGSAYRPSDVLRIRGGKTVENANTDAEGRLVLADTLARAAEEKPDLIVDVATLTGACMVALGERVAGLLASDDQVADQLLDAAESAGELFWQLPIPEEAKDKLKSSVADLKSSGDRYGGALTAAAFLREFTAGLPWAHLDIAGPAFNKHSPYYYLPEGATGMSIRTMVALAVGLAGQK